MRLETAATLAEADRAPLLDLWVDAWTGALPSIDFPARRPWFSTYLDGLLAAGAILLLCREGEGAPPTAFLTLDRASGEIDQLAVGLPFQGQGLAHAMLDEAKRLAPGGLTLTVNTSNTRAIFLYERAGFVRTRDGVSPRSGLPVWVMRWLPD